MLVGGIILGGLAGGASWMTPCKGESCSLEPQAPSSDELGAWLQHVSSVLKVRSDKKFSDEVRSHFRSLKGKKNVAVVSNLADKRSVSAKNVAALLYLLSGRVSAMSGSGATALALAMDRLDLRSS